MAEPQQPSQTLLDRLQDFVSENKRALILGTAAAALAVGGAAYYASTSRTHDDDAEKGTRRAKDADKDKRRSTKDKKKRKGVKDKDGFILEEKKHKVEDEMGE
jgi:import receptor subunit TOM70